MLKRTVRAVFLGSFILAVAWSSFAQEDKVVQVAIDTVKTQMRLPKGAEIKFIEKKESPIPGFYQVKLSFMAPDREIPLIVYVDRDGEKVILGSLFVKGENLTRKEAGEPKPRKIEVGQLELDKSPSRGPADAKVTVVEFSNFQCPYCVRSYKKVKELLEKYPKEIRYVFKHFPLQAQKKNVEVSELAAAAGAVSPEAFWLLHDFLFSDEGQKLAAGEKEDLKKKIEALLGEKGFDVKAFQAAVESGKGKKRVEEDLALGQKIGIRGTPSGVINGEIRVGPIVDKVIEGYLGK